MLDEIAALSAALDDAAQKAHKLAEYDIDTFGEVYARAELVRQTMQIALKRRQHKSENGQKMAILNELRALRRR